MNAELSVIRRGTLRVEVCACNSATHPGDVAHAEKAVIHRLLSQQEIGV